MVFFVYGAVGALAVLGLLALGFFAGWKLHGMMQNHNRTAVTEEVPEDMRRQLLAQQQAFQTMLGYNQDTAYGMNGGDDR